MSSGAEERIAHAAAPTHSRRDIAAHIAVALVLLTALAAVNRPGFLLFHSFAEIFTIVIAVSTGLVAWNAREYLENDYLLFIGIGQLFISILDALHLLGYKGMGVFAQSGPNLSTQLWIAGRYVGSATVVLAALFFRRRVPLLATIATYFAVTATLITLIFEGDFPTCFTTGLTPFKVWSEFIIAALYSAGAWLLFRDRRSLPPAVFHMIFASIILRVVAELCFAVYAHVYDVLSFSGHYIRILAFYLLYKAIFEAGIVRPYGLVVRDLREREKELQRSVQELEAFSYSVSHDLRSPLAVVDGFTQLLETDEGLSMKEQHRTYLRQIRGAVRRMTELIQDLLEFSRSGRAEMSIVPVDISSIAAEVAGEMRSANATRNVEVKVDDGMVCSGDEHLLRVVMENLVGNAFKYTSKHDQARIEIRKAGDQEESTVFLVRDDGAGFDMSRATGRLFRPFQRLHSSTEFEGTGVGLATVSRIIERHGGRVWAESEVEKGTTIYVALPDRPAVTPRKSDA